MSGDLAIVTSTACRRITARPGKRQSALHCDLAPVLERIDDDEPTFAQDREPIGDLFDLAIVIAPIGQSRCFANGFVLAQSSGEAGSNGGPFASTGARV